MTRIKATIHFCLLVALSAFACSLPWWFYNVSVFGHPLPVSGLSQVDLAPSFWAVASSSVNVLLDSFLPGLHTPEGWDFERLSLFGLIVPLVLGGAYLVSGRSGAIGESIRSWRTGIDFVVLRPLLLYGAFLFIAYTFFFAAPHFQERYLILFRIFGIIGYATLFFAFISGNSSQSKNRPLTILVSATGVLVLLVNLGLMYRFYNGSYNNPLLQTVAWIGENSEPTDQIGIFQSGTPEYFYPLRVTNLDGKVNVAAHTAFRSGRMGQYVDSMGFAYIIDWALYTDRIFQESRAETHYIPIDTLPNNMVVWKKSDG